MSIYVHAVNRPEVSPLTMSDRFRTEIAYFMSVPGEPGIPALGDGEYWVRHENASRWLDEGVMHIVSPLDSQNQTEVELSEEQEDWLEWMVRNRVEHVRLANAP